MNIIIVGGGKVGGYLASRLLEGKYKVKLIEEREEHLRQLRHDLPVEVIVAGSGTSPSILEATGIRQSQMVVAVTGSDETNLVVASLARFEYSVPRVIARVNNPKNAWLFTPDMGVDVALNQPDLLVQIIADEMPLTEKKS